MPFNSEVLAPLQLGKVKNEDKQRMHSLEIGIDDRGDKHSHRMQIVENEEDNYIS